MELPLEGLRVLDFSQIVAGPSNSQMMADMGAEVIKVEKVGGGEFLRNTSYIYKNGESVSFLGLNRNKKSLAIDLSQPAGKEIIYKLAAKSDVVLENFRPGVLDRLALGYEALSRVNPGIVFCSISGYGPDGPYVDLPGQDLLVQGYGGMQSYIGDPDVPPVVVGGGFCDLTAGFLSAWGVMVALWHRQKTGVGQKVGVSLLDSSIVLQTNEANFYLNGSETPYRVKAGLFSMAPYGPYRTKDHYINVNATSLQRWRTLCRAMGVPELAEDPRYDTMAKRAAAREEVRAMLEQTLTQKTTAEWLRIFAEAGVLCGPIQDFDQVFTDPQVLRNKMVEEFEHPRAGKVRVVGIPVKLSRTPGTVRTPPPAVGQHTDELLQELGYSDEEITGLRAAKVV